MRAMSARLGLPSHLRAIALLVIVVLCAARAAAAPAERIVLEPTEMRREIGLAWYVTLPPGWEADADDVDHQRRSTAVMRASSSDGSNGLAM